MDTIRDLNQTWLNVLVTGDFKESPEWVSKFNGNPLRMFVPSKDSMLYALVSFINSLGFFATIREAYVDYDFTGHMSNRIAIIVEHDIDDVWKVTGFVRS